MSRRVFWICQIVVIMLFVATAEAQYLTPRYEVKVENDVKYGNAKGFWASYPTEENSFAKIYLGRADMLFSERDLDLTMDIYQPVNDSEQLRPLIMFMHGGSFLNGDKAEQTFQLWCSHFASLGYVAVSANYRMGWAPDKTDIDIAGYRATQDAYTALSYLAHNADFYHIDPDLVFVGGTSAGAITALNVAFLNEDNKPQSVVGEGPISRYADYPESFHIAAVMNMWGAVYDTAILRDSKTSIISFHGDADPIIPYAYGYPFVKVLEKKEGEVPEGFLGSLMTWIIPESNSEFWGNIISPMYGSQCIDKYCKDHGIRSELHTAPGEGHGFHLDKNHQFTPYFSMIQDSITSFLNEEIMIIKGGGNKK